MATTLAAGDLVITGFNFDNPDEFSFVPLTDITTGTAINFTDDGVQSNGTFRSSEGTFTWIATQNYSAGDIITPSVTSVAFSSSGDQIIAYQGASSNPNFIYALNSEGSDWQANATSANTSALPPGLINGETAIALNESDNAIYAGPTNGTVDAIRAAVSDTTNWTRSNSSRFTFPSGAFTITEPADSDSVYLLFGNPSNATTDINNPDNYLLLRDQYALSYNDSRKMANWSSWQLNSSWLGNAPRQDDFREDTSLPPGLYQVSEDDYVGSGFDRGHITPSADRTATIADNSATFVMTNMMPQAPDNNRNTWGNLEDFSRELVIGNPNITSDDQELYIVAGSYGVGGVGSNGPLNFISVPGGNDITVPDRTWKAILVLDNPGDGVEDVSFDNRIIAVDIPNDQGITSDWREFRVSVDDIEANTGLDLFANLPDIIEASLEAQVDGFATTLSAGDIAITGFNFDTPDDFSFVFLTDVLAGTEIQFTDKGVLSNGLLRGSEDIYTWRSERDYSAGEVVVIPESESDVTLSASGDQIIAFQGSSSNPTYLYGLNSEGNTGWQADATNTATSALPTGLVNGQTAIALNEIDNAIYTGTTIGSRTELLAALSNPSNWSGSNSTRQPLSTKSFTLTTGNGFTSSRMASSTAALVNTELHSGVLAGSLGDDEIFGTEGDDVIRGDRNERASQGTIAGGHDILHGGAGSDRIGGKSGHDSLFGDEGDDQLWGDSGDDPLRGGPGNDTLTGDNFSGDTGSDVFVLAVGEGTDTITDFEVGVDAIGLAHGLTFEELTLEGNTIKADSETLAILNSVDTTGLTNEAFVMV